MKIKSLFLNWIITLTVAVLFCAFQTTFWYQFIGKIGAPQLWLNLIIFIALFRRPFEGLMLTYVLALLFKQWTSMPIGLIWLTLLIFQMIMVYLKSRVFWPGTRYFVLASLTGVIIYNIVHFVVSRAIENNPAPVQFLSLTMEIILTPLWAAPVYWLLSAIDAWTFKDLVSEGTEA